MISIKEILDYMKEDIKLPYYMFFEFLILAFFIGLFFYSQICEQQCYDKINVWIEENQDYIDNKGIDLEKMFENVTNKLYKHYNDSYITIT